MPHPKFPTLYYVARSARIRRGYPTANELRLIVRRYPLSWVIA
jgi:hypothetical protein